MPSTTWQAPGTLTGPATLHCQTAAFYQPAEVQQSVRWPLPPGLMTVILRQAVGIADDVHKPLAGTSTDEFLFFIFFPYFYRQTKINVLYINIRLC
jgi:hypothetical protein